MRILKDKKGLALENAILFMMIIFSLCFLLASFALIGHYQAKIENIKIIQRVELDQIGEDYLENRQFPLEGIYDNYEWDNGTNTLRVWRKNDPEKKTVLYVEVDNDGKVLAWRYSE